ncbi:MAG: sigma-70 family RNA polymerase sigma factor [Gemmatimonadota bacterium]|nr:sigma-70 family RNA polymerase sigma factor [Gemmatimonadota bacterium]
MEMGDEAALGELYDALSPMAYALAGAILRDADDVEEVVEDAFWQVWKQAGRYTDTRGGVSTWVGVIARTRALDRLRSRRRRREEAWADVPEGSFDPDRTSPNPLQDAVAAERREVVAEAMRELPEEQRRALELAYFQGMSQTEISEHTGQPLGTVKTRVRLALAKLRERLAPLGRDLR